jgi:hypothetical protein
MPPIGTAYLNKTSLNKESNILVTFDFSKRHELKFGATVVSVTMNVMLNNIASSDLSLNTPVIDPTGRKVQVRVTDVSSVVGNNYSLVCEPVLSDTTTLVESIIVTITQD